MRKFRCDFSVFIVMMLSVTILDGCATQWQHQVDSCTYESSDPPMRRVINYNDHGLCDRALAPRTPPNPRARLQQEMTY